ncbi:MAG: MBL fold metallo-hydrolase [Polyangiales bacterium]
MGMAFHHLGHACWLAEAAGLRLLFDPLIDSLHHGGVFELVPRRRLDVAALAADFVFVSHRHPDHFDLASLRALCAHDADAVVVTSDPLVERCARRIGFRDVRRIDADTHVALEGVRFVTTGSVDPGTVEWGVMIACEGAVVWNQVDTVQASAAATRQMVARSLASLEAEAVSLALVRWHPLLEIHAQLGGRASFPHEHYAAVVEQIAAIDARALVPASAGARHAAPFDAMNHLVYPVPEARFLRDIAARLPGTPAFAAKTGATFRVDVDGVACDPIGGRSLLAWCEDEAPDPRVFRPFVIEPIVDPNLDQRRDPDMREAIERWVRERLAPSLVRPLSDLGRQATLVLEVVLPNGTDAFTLVLDGARHLGEVRVERRFEDDYDALVSIAGSMLCDVLEGKRHWGDPLLGGLLRGATRMYRVDGSGVRALPFAKVFLYYALGYEESVLRALEHELSQSAV